MRNLTLVGKIVNCKTIATSKKVFQSFTTTAPKLIANKLEKIQKTFFWKTSSPKIKYETFCNEYKVRELKNVDIANKIIALQYFCIKRLYDNSIHKQKLILLSLIEKPFGTSFKFHQIYYLKVINSSFFHLSTGKLFRIGKNILP